MAPSLALSIGVTEGECAELAVQCALRKLKLGNQERRGIAVLCLHDGERGWRMLKEWEISV